MKPVRWAWCETCTAWVGAEPPLLPPYWSLDKAAAMHHAARPDHRIRRLSIDDLRKAVIPGI